MKQNVHTIHTVELQLFFCDPYFSNSFCYWNTFSNLHNIYIEIISINDLTEKITRIILGNWQFCDNKHTQLCYLSLYKFYFFLKIIFPCLLFLFFSSDYLTCILLIFYACQKFWWDIITEFSFSQNIYSYLTTNWVVNLYIYELLLK